MEKECNCIKKMRLEKEKIYITQQKIDDSRTIFQIWTDMLQIYSNFRKGGRRVLCTKEESTRQISDCKGFEDSLNIEMYEEAISKIEDMGNKRLRTK